MKYYWFRCKMDGSQRKPIQSKGNKATIAECNDTSGGHYICQVVAIEQGKQLCSIDSALVCVDVVNSTKITITKEPPHEMLVTLGEKLTLECKASCEHHPVKYQWYHKSNPVDNATQLTLTIQSVLEKDIGSYYCIITSDYCETRAVSRVTDVRGE